MDIGHHHKLALGSNWDHQLQPYNNMVAMESHGNNMLLHHHGQNPHHGHEIMPYEQHTQWTNYNPPPPLQNQPQNVVPLQDGRFKLDIDLGDQDDDEEEEELGAMKELMFRVAAMQPVDIDPATIRKPKRRNVRISEDPQSVAARHRREKISEKMRILQRLVPGGTKMDTASMLDEAVRYVRFLKKQIRILQVPNHYGPPNVGPASASAEDWLLAAAAVGAGNPSSSSSSQVNVGTSYDFFGGNNVTHDHHGSIGFNRA